MRDLSRLSRWLESEAPDWLALPAVVLLVAAVLVYADYLTAPPPWP